MIHETIDHGLIAINIAAPQNGVSGSITVSMIGVGGTIRTFHGQEFEEAAQKFWKSAMGVLGIFSNFI